MDASDVARLVAMRDSRASWKDIGRAFGKQDAVCSAIYARAKAEAALAAAAPDKAERQAATLPPCAR